MSNQTAERNPQSDQPKPEPVGGSVPDLLTKKEPGDSASAEMLDVWDSNYVPIYANNAWGLIIKALRKVYDIHTIKS